MLLWESLEARGQKTKKERKMITETRKNLQKMEIVSTSCGISTFTIYVS